MTNYKFGNKNHWRRTAWNRIAERLPRAPKDCIVIYLPGPLDLDRQEALRRGFRPDNLIGVDRAASVVHSLREGRALALQADFLDAVDAWSPQRRLDVVFGDFTSGLELKTGFAVATWLGYPHLGDSVFAFNFLRGRDASSNPVRGIYEGLAEWGRAMGERVETPRLRHRGAQLLALMAVLLAREHAGRGVPQPEMVVTFLAELNLRLAPSLLSYRSGTQVFDSLVFRNTIGALVSPEARQRTIAALRANAPHTTKQRLAAVLAHRTMRVG